MKKFNPSNVIAIIIWLLPIAYLVYIYSSLPPVVPLHYGADGVPNQYGSRAKFVLVQGLLLAISGGLYLLLNFLPSIDPKQYAKSNPAAFQKLAIGILLFLSALSVLITYATVQRQLKMDGLMLPFLGLLFAFLGNVMYNIKPNYFAGFRTPWTLDNEDNWRATHRLGGKIWFWGGLIIAVLTFIIHGKVVFPVFIASVIIITLIPCIYSYLYFKKHQPK
jgi:uncharacterized membrane protein